ncbi:hypothetical protein AKJ16_DCAP21972, partial [Drosera capensis]
MESSCREVRRVFSRFSRHNTTTNCKSSSGLSDGGEKPNRGEKSKDQKKPVRRSSAVEDKDSPSQAKMGADGRRKIMVPNEIFGDRNPVDHSSVPRKLRSAMTKGMCKSASQPLFDQKRSYCTENNPDPIKRSKMDKQNGISDRSARQAVSGTITKEEEDVAKILYGLAGLGPGNGCSLENKLDGDCSIAKPVEPFNEQQDSTLVAEVLRRDSEVNVLPTSIEATHKSLAKGLLPVENSCDADPASGVDQQATSVEFPSWLRTAVSSNKNDSYESLNYGGKVSAIPSSKARSQKRCATHVCIAHVIQELQVSKLNSIQHFEDRQPYSSEDLSKGALHKKPDHVDSKERKVSSAILFPCNVVGSNDPKNYKEAGNCALMLKSPQQTIKQAPDPHEPDTKMNQGFDFLSLSTRSCYPVAKADDVPRERLQPPVQAHVPYMPPLPRCGPVVSFMFPENHPPSSSYRDQNSTAAATLSPQVHQVPAYVNSQIGPLHFGLATSTTRLQLQQQQIWAANNATAQYGPGALTAAKIYHWQNTVQGQHSSMQLMQAFFSPPVCSGATAPKGLLISQQEQQLTALASTSPSIKSKTAN